jgi:hypothetical protein
MTTPEHIPKEAAAVNAMCVEQTRIVNQTCSTPADWESSRGERNWK